jgi:hypothetical protein
MPAIRKEPSDLVLTSTTETQEQMDHAVSDDWRKPFVPAAEKAAEEEKKKKDDAKNETIEEKSPEVKLGNESEKVSDNEKRREGVEEAPRGDKDDRGKGGWQKRVDTLTARNTKISEDLRFERESRERLEARLAALERGEKSPASGERGTEKAAEGTIPDLPGKPVRDQFKSNEEYMEKYLGWLRKNEDHKDAVQAENDRLKTVFDGHRARVLEARTRISDYEEVMNDPETAKMTLHPALHNAIMEMDNGPDVLYYVATHPEVYEKLKTMTPLKGIGEFTRISDKLAAQAKPPAGSNGRKERPKVEPIAAGGRRSSTSGKTLEDMSTDDYVAARRTMRQARRN